MPNSIKYNVSAETLSLKKGNFWIGTGDVGKGPTSETGYWNGITPPSGGYTIYLNKESEGPSIYVNSNDDALITRTNKIAGTSFTGANECLTYFATQTDKMVFNIDYESIITSGLSLNLDAGFTPSYPKNGETWYDITSGDYNGTLINEPTFNSANGGSIVLDGVDDYVSIPKTGLLSGKNSFTVSLWTYPTSLSGIRPLFLNYYVGNLELMLRFNNTNLQFYTYSTTNVQAGGTTQVYSTLNQWVNIVATYNGSVMMTYVNGVQSPTTYNRTGNLNTSILPYLIGRYSSPTEYRYSGRFAQTLVYLRALSSDEILQNYNVTKSRFGL